MHFFLQGEPLIGKSYLLQHGLQKHHLSITGYTPQRLYHDKEIAAYRIEPIKDNKIMTELDGQYDVDKSNIFLDFQKQYKKISVLEDTIKEVHINAQVQAYDLILLDEIGGFELESEKFIHYLFDLLEYHSCIGVIKHASRHKTHSDNQQIIENNYQTLISKIQQNGDIYTLDALNKDEITHKFDDFLNKINENAKG